MTTLIALHGFSQNGAEMRRQMGELGVKLAEGMHVIYPDGPVPCSTEMVEKVYGTGLVEDHGGPYQSWWRASDDGSTYEGWEKSRDQMGSLISEQEEVGLIGFSQGAILSTAVAALSQAGLLPPIKFVVLLAGAAPRAHVFSPLLKEPLQVPSLHVWGKRDALMRKGAPDLVTRFSEATRQVVNFDLGHVIPKDGDPAEKVLAFVRSQAHL